MEQNGPYAEDILPVTRTRDEARQFYDRISSIYGCLTGAFERRYAEKAVRLLSVQEGETVLEIGFGPGYCLKQIAESVGKTGKTYGIDISPGMVKVTRKRLGKARLIDRVELYCGDAISPPYANDTFDAVFMSYTLELFDTPEIPMMLQEVKRLLKTGGRLGVACMSKDNGNSKFLRLYEWLHQRWPKYFDCRPIYLEQSLKNAGYETIKKEKVKLLGLLPNEIIVSVKTG